MNNQTNLLGSILSVGAKKFRVLHFSNDSYVLCQMETPSINIFSYSAKFLFHQIEIKQLTIIPEESPIIVDLDSLSEKEKESFFSKKEIVDKIVAQYGPLFLDLANKRPKPFIKELTDHYHIAKSTIWRYIRCYLQSGFAPSSLIDNRTIRQKDVLREHYIYQKKPGRPPKSGIQTGIILIPSVYEQFDEALNRFKKGNAASLIDGYRWMLASHYVRIAPDGARILPPISEMPSKRQFYYYCSKHLSKEEYDIVKLGKVEQRNARRLLTGNSRADAIRPGQIVEVDAVEADVSLVSKQFPNQSIGRPTVYMMVDVYSSVIVAVSIGLEENSAIGATNLLLNLLDDKVMLCKKYDIDIDAKLWPSNFIPRELRCDRGPEFKGSHFSEACKLLGITKTMEPGATGSMKGIVEQVFHQFQTQLRSHLVHAGLITKKYNSKHHRESMLSLDDFTKMVLSFVVTHNSKHILNYPITKEMLQEPEFQPIPATIWEYGCEKHGNPTLIMEKDHDQFIACLMKKQTAKISKRGVEFQGLFYYSPDDLDLNREMYDCENKRKSFSILWDPRSMKKIYYMRENKLLSIPLNPNLSYQLDFGEMSHAEYTQYKKRRSQLKIAGRYHNENVEAFRYLNNESVVDSAKKDTLSDTSNIQKARREEKHRMRQQNKLDQALLPHAETLSAEVQKSIPENTTGVQNDPLEVPDDLKDAYKIFMNNEAKKHDL